MSSPTQRPEGVAGNPWQRSVSGIIQAEVADMKMRAIVAALGLLLLMVAIPPSVAAKEATVTLAISGMT